MAIALKVLRCAVCGYEWIPRVPEPKRCPMGSHKWNGGKK